MKKYLDILRQRSRLLFAFVLMLLLVSILALISALYYKDARMDTKEVTITNLTDTGLTVTWVSDEPYKGKIIYKEGKGFWPPIFAQIGKQTAYDDRDLEQNQNGDYILKKAGQQKRYTHHVTLRNLNPETEYSFRIAGKIAILKTSKNTAKTYSVNEDLKTPDPAYGAVSNMNDLNKLPKDGIVYFSLSNPGQLQVNSNTYSTTLSDESTWSIDSSNILNQGGNTFVKTKDTIVNIEVKSEIGKARVNYSFTKYKPLPLLYINTVLQSMNSRNDKNAMQTSLLTNVLADKNCGNKCEAGGACYDSGFIADNTADKSKPIGTYICDGGAWKYLGPISQQSTTTNPPTTCANMEMRTCTEKYKETCNLNGVRGIKDCTKIGKNPCGVAGTTCPWDASMGSKCGECEVDPTNPTTSTNGGKLLEEYAGQEPEVASTGNTDNTEEQSNNQNSLAPGNCYLHGSRNTPDDPNNRSVPYNIADPMTSYRVGDECFIILGRDQNEACVIRTCLAPETSSATDITTVLNVPVVDTAEVSEDSTESPYNFTNAYHRSGDNCVEDTNLCTTSSGICDNLRDNEIAVDAGSNTTYYRDISVCQNVPSDVSGTCSDQKTPETIYRLPCTNFCTISNSYAFLTRNSQGKCVIEVYDNFAPCDYQNSETERIDSCISGHSEIETPNLLRNVKAATGDKLPVTSSGEYVFFENGEKIAEKKVVLNGENAVYVKLYNDTNANGKKDTAESFYTDYSQITLSQKTLTKAYKINSGWNLITFPVYDTSLTDAVQTASALIDNWNAQGLDIKHVARYKAGKFELFTKRENNTAFANDFDLIPGEAYFVFNVGKTKTVTFDGKVIQGGVKIDLVNGWNLVGFINPEEKYTSETVIKKINETSIKADTISRYQSGLYDSVIYEDKVLYGNNFDILDTQGYFVKVTEGGGNSFTP